MMNESTLKKLLAEIPRHPVGVLGDFCVDAYWELRPELGERSIETGIVTTPVASARYSPGGAGNVAANLRGLGARRIFCFGAVGDDPFGHWLSGALFPESGDAGGRLLRVGRAQYHTPVYCKPLLDGREQSRFDLGGEPIDDSEAGQLLESLETALPQLEVLIVNQQLHHGIHTDTFRREFAALLARTPRPPLVVFDGREHLDAYRGVILKINSTAASQLAFGHPEAPPERSGAAVAQRTGNEVVVTDGENGCFVFARGETTFIPAIRLPGPVDTVGAGDSFSAGFALALASGFPMTAAAEFGNLCAAVTIRKLAQTGTPSPEEITALFAESLAARSR